MSNHKHQPNVGHVNILVATLLACVGLIILTIGAVQINSTLAWIGGIGAAVMLLLQMHFVHSEIGNLWGQIDELKKQQ